MTDAKFAVTDPRGRTVVCSEDRWLWHIVELHGSMAGRENEVMEALESPSIGIYSDADFDDREIYYLRRKNNYLKVVVKFDDDDRGEVVTAFITRHLKSGETLIWPSLKA